VVRLARQPVGASIAILSIFASFSLLEASMTHSTGAPFKRSDSTLLARCGQGRQLHTQICAARERYGGDGVRPTAGGPVRAEGVLKGIRGAVDGWHGVCYYVIRNT